MKRIFGLLICLVLVSLVSAKSYAVGEIDGYFNAADAARMAAGWYDMQKLNVVGSSVDTIVIDTVYGKGTVARQFINLTSSDGFIICETIRGSWVRLPIPALGETSILPTIRRVVKTGTVDSLIVKIQKINQ
jgi:hypothetical protein